MPSPLLVSEEDPVPLDGSVDAANDLQMKHGTDSLSDYDQRLEAKHTDLNLPTGIVRIKLNDFSHGGYTWETSATHNAGSVAWSRSSGHAYYDFGPMTSELDVTVVATSNATPPTTKQRVVKLKTKPADSQPDRPPV